MKFEQRQFQVFLEFQNNFLRYLEPRCLAANYVFQRQKESFDEILFPLSGAVEVGYNKEYYLFENGVKSASEMSRSIVRRKTQKNAIFDFSSKNEALKQEKFVYPLKIYPGQAIGLFNMLFDKKSLYLYRIHRDQTIDSMFIRKSNWHKFQTQVSEDLEDAFTCFKKFALVNYINNIYFRLQSHQSKLLKSEKLS